MEEYENQEISELDRVYMQIRDMPLEHFGDADQQKLRTMLANETLRRALNLMLRGTFNILVEANTLNILSDQEHTENALRAQGRVKGVVDSVMYLLQLAGFDEEAPVIPFPGQTNQEG
jgi:hypothetical protein